MHGTYSNDGILEEGVQHCNIKERFWLTVLLIPFTNECNLPVSSKQKQATAFEVDTLRLYFA